MKLDVKHIAKLANLTLSSDEEDKFQKQLGDVITHIEQLNSLETTDVTPTAQITNLENVFREDVIHESFSQDEAVSQAKRVHNGLFEVKGVFEDE